MDQFDQQWQRWFPEDRDRKPAPPSKPKKTGRIILVLAGVLVLFILLNISKSIYTEWLWFSSLDYGSVFTTVLNTRLLVFFLAALVFCLLFMGNLMLAARLAPAGSSIWPWALVSRLQKGLKIAVILLTAVLCFIFGMVAQGNWDIILRFYNAQPFNVADPVFGRDVSFYVFSLPFLNFLRGWLLSAFIITLLGSAAVYLLSYTAQRQRFNWDRPVLGHIGGLFIAILGIGAWGYWLGIWELVFSTRGVIAGASYTDMNVQIPVQWFLIGVVILYAGTVLVAILKRRFRWILYGLVGWLGLAIIAGAIIPAMIQRFKVQPNEFALEKPYIEYNIQYTRQAFGLDGIEEQSYPAEETPTTGDIAANQVTLNNIRLWDPRPLKDTYNQIQSIRLYYDFNDIDIDRYTIDGDYRQVMLSARELSAEKLAGEAQTWVNRKLQFTHGYGIALSPVNEISSQGLPNLLIKDIPPTGEFEITQPQIYFGEKTDEYVIVNTNTQEFDFPMGEENVYGEYQGEDGVSLNGFWRRLAYAWDFGDLNILISGELTPQSRVLYHRNIKERVSQLAPFLQLDNDPYLVIQDGRLVWILDAYTITDRYPYSQPVQSSRLNSRLNYIRNSVKVVVDAYNGHTTFYVNAPDDALIKTYQAIFPDLFVPGDQMPESLREHIRCPEDMFLIQANQYQSYHMQDARVFYNKEDQWSIPKEVYYGEQQQTVAPYYIIMRLPDEAAEEFILMLPFTPVNKNNTIGWLAARCDGEHYGTMLAYLFPKEKMVYGPSQIENRIGQDTIITEQLALWGRGGSRVLRGNLLMIPVGESIIYVEPVFLQAESGGLPELKRVIVAAGENIVMEPTLEESIQAIFGTEVTPEVPEIPPEPTPPPVTPTGDIAQLIAEARQHYEQAQQYLKDGDWAGYGAELEALKAILERLAELTAVTE